MERRRRKTVASLVMTVLAARAGNAAGMLPCWIALPPLFAMARLVGSIRPAMR